jgi:hypothetical protein
MLGDSACNSFLLNESTSHLSHDVESYNGTVLGSNEPMPYAITKGALYGSCVLKSDVILVDSVKAVRDRIG